jgi:phospholipase C
MGILGKNQPAPNSMTRPFKRQSNFSKECISRRHFLQWTTTSVLTVAGGGFLSAGTAAAAARVKALPKPHRSGIEHVVIVMMENRSFDHLLGWLPGADGRQAGLTYVDRAGVSHPTAPLAPDFQGCDHPDPDHSYEGGRIEYNNGACDGWLRAGENDLYSIGYYTQQDVPFLANAAQNFTTLDRYFCSIMAETFPNKIHQHAAQTDRLDNTFEISSLPTIWDRLAEHDLEGRYYFSDVPFTALWGAKYLPITRPLSEFVDDCAAGTLPHVSMVDPRFLGEDIGLSNDDHPHADIRNGEVFLNSIYEAVTSSPNWENTVLVFNFDEWGGFFEHVPPPVGPIPPGDAALGSDGLRGFRVPCVVVSPWSAGGTVAHGIYDHASVLKMIEWRWHLRALTNRDATANNLAEVLNFSRPQLEVPSFAVPPGPHGGLCPLVTPQLSKWDRLGELAATLGFAP